MGYDGYELNTVAFGKAKGKGKAKGYQSKGYQPSGAKGQKGFEKGKGGKGSGEGKAKGGKGNYSSQLKKSAAGLIVFTGACYACL